MPDEILIFDTKFDAILFIEVPSLIPHKWMNKFIFEKSLQHSLQCSSYKHFNRQL